MFFYASFLWLKNRCLGHLYTWLPSKINTCHCVHCHSRLFNLFNYLSDIMASSHDVADQYMDAYLADVHQAVGGGAGAGASGMVAERVAAMNGMGESSRIPSGFYGGLAEAFSRSQTPPNNPIPSQRHRFRGERRSTSPRRASLGTPPNPMRAHSNLPQLQYEEDMYNEDLERRFLKLENLQRSTAQFVAMDHRAITAVSEQINHIMTKTDANMSELMSKTDGIMSGLAGHVLVPIQQLKDASVEQYERIKMTQIVVEEHQRQLAELMAVARDIQVRVTQAPPIIQQSQPWPEAPASWQATKKPEAPTDFVAWPLQEAPRMERQREIVVLDNGQSFRRWAAPKTDVQTWMMGSQTTTQTSMEHPVSSAQAAAPAMAPTPTGNGACSYGSNVPFDPWANSVAEAKASAARIEAEQATLDEQQLPFPPGGGPTSYDISSPLQAGSPWTGGGAPRPAMPPGFGQGGGGGGPPTGPPLGGGGGGPPGGPPPGGAPYQPAAATGPGGTITALMNSRWCKA